MSKSFEATFWLVICTLEAVFIICCNILGIVIFSKKARRSRPCLLLTNQCVADVLVGIQMLYSVTIQSTITYDLTPTEDAKCKNHALLIINNALFVLSTEASFASLGFISLERAYAVFRPFKHRVLRKKSYFYGIGTIWFVAAVQSLISILFSCHQNELRLLDLLYGLVFILFLFTLLVIMISYVAIYIKLRFFPILQNTPHRRNEIKLCKTLFYASLASVITFLPFIFVRIYIRANCIRDVKCLPAVLMGCAEVIFLSNSFVNFFIYAWRFPEFVKSAKKLLLCSNA